MLLAGDRFEEALHYVDAIRSKESTRSQNHSNQHVCGRNLRRSLRPPGVLQGLVDAVLNNLRQDNRTKRVTYQRAQS